MQVRPPLPHLLQRRVQSDHGSVHCVAEQAELVGIASGTEISLTAPRYLVQGRECDLTRRVQVRSHSPWLCFQPREGTLRQLTRSWLDRSLCVYIATSPTPFLHPPRGKPPPTARPAHIGFPRELGTWRVYRHSWWSFGVLKALVRCRRVVMKLHDSVQLAETKLLCNT